MTDSQEALGDVVVVRAPASMDRLLVEVPAGLEDELRDLLRGAGIEYSVPVYESLGEIVSNVGTAISYSGGALALARTVRPVLIAYIERNKEKVRRVKINGDSLEIDNFSERRAESMFKKMLEKRDAKAAEMHAVLSEENDESKLGRGPASPGAS